MLAVNALSGFGSGGVTVPVTVVYEDSAVTDSTATTLTFSSMDLGTEAANRHIVVGVGNGGGAPGECTAVTVDGESCSELVQNTGPGDGYHSASLWIVALPSGTSEDVVITLSNGDPRVGVDTFAVYGASATAADTADDTKSDPLDLTISCPANGVIIGKAFAGNDAAVWSNITERNDETVAAAYKHSCASDAFEAEQTDLAVTCDNGTSTDNVGVAVSLGPK